MKICMGKVYVRKKCMQSSDVNNVKERKAKEVKIIVWPKIAEVSTHL